MSNIQFNYRYRDGGNYKSFNAIIFSNPDNQLVSYLDQLIRSKLIDETYFYANQWNVPNLYFTAFNPDTDPTWHEFENVEYTNLEPNAPLTLSNFIKLIIVTKLPY